MPCPALLATCAIPFSGTRTVWTGLAVGNHAGFSHRARLAPALFVLLAQLAAPLLVCLGLAGGHRVDSGGRDLDRQSHDIDCRLGDRAHDLAAEHGR